MIQSKDTVQDHLVVFGTFLINNRYATILFDSGVDKSFITPTFKQHINHEYSKLDATYKVKVTNGKIERTIEIVKNCTITLKQPLIPNRFQAHYDRKL